MAAAVNTTVDGVTNKARGHVYAGEFSQQLPGIELQVGDAPAKDAERRSSKTGKPFFNGNDLTGWKSNAG